MEAEPSAPATGEGTAKAGAGRRQWNGRGMDIVVRRDRARKDGWDSAGQESVMTWPEMIAGDGTRGRKSRTKVSA